MYGDQYPWSQAHCVLLSNPKFRWSGEATGTVRRDVVFVNSAGATNVGSAEAFGTHFKVPVGTYTWFVVFKDKSGRPLCRTPLIALWVGTDEQGAFDNGFQHANGHGICPGG